MSAPVVSWTPEDTAWLQSEAGRRAVDGFREGRVKPPRPQPVVKSWKGRQPIGAVVVLIDEAVRDGFTRKDVAEVLAWNKNGVANALAGKVATVPDKVAERALWVAQVGIEAALKEARA